MKTTFCQWIKAAAIRAVRTMAQTAIALIGTGALGVADVDWIAVLSATALAGILSVLTSVAGIPEADSPCRRAADRGACATDTASANGDFANAGPADTAPASDDVAEDDVAADDFADAAGTGEPGQEVQR